jgi:hypothetical protein
MLITQPVAFLIFGERFDSKLFSAIRFDLPSSYIYIWQKWISKLKPLSSQISFYRISKLRECSQVKQEECSLILEQINAEVLLTFRTKSKINFPQN